MQFSFRLRNSRRDLETDELRFERIGRMAGEIRAEIQNEMEGLKRRYESISSSAAFAQQAYEDDTTREDLSVRVRELTGVMMQYTRRMATLGRQRDFAAKLEEEIANFRDANARQFSSSL